MRPADGHHATYHNICPRHARGPLPFGGTHVRTGPTTWRRPPGIERAAPHNSPVGGTGNLTPEDSPGTAIATKDTLDDPAITLNATRTYSHEFYVDLVYQWTIGATSERNAT